MLVDTDKDRIKDGDEKFYQTFTHQVENVECVIEEVAVSLEGSGCLQTNTTIESIMETDWMCAEVVGLVGEPFDVKTEVKFDRATLTFKLDKDKLGETPFENLMFLWYDEENYKFVELETILDEENGTVSVETTHFSKYMIVDREVWHNAWLVDLGYNTESYSSYYTVLAIDCSGSMSWNDKITINNNVNSQYDAMHRKSCNRIKGATEFINNMSATDMTAIVLFDDSAYYFVPFTNNKTQLKLELQNVDNLGGTSYESALSKALELFEHKMIPVENTCKRVVMLTDGEGSCSKSILRKLKSKNIVVHGIGLGDHDYSALQELTELTDGNCVITECSDDLQILYKMMYNVDGLVNIDKDDDGLLDGEEIDNEIQYGFVDYIVDGETYRGCGYYLVMKTDPNLSDSDGDGIRDDADTAPMEKGIYSTSEKAVVVGELIIIRKREYEKGEIRNKNSDEYHNAVIMDLVSVIDRFLLL